MSGLVDYLPRRGWIIVLTLLGIAAGSLVIPSAVGPPTGESFVPFFWIVSGIQLATALGITATVMHYRDPNPETGEWKYDP